MVVVLDMVELDSQPQQLLVVLVVVLPQDTVGIALEVLEIDKLELLHQ
jgi:hypothetical protein